MNLDTLKRDGRQLFAVGNTVYYGIGTEVYRVTMEGKKAVSIEQQPTKQSTAPEQPAPVPSAPAPVSQNQAKGQLSYRLIPDENPENPCTEDDGYLSKVIIFHRRYDFGNCKDFATPDAFSEFRQEHPEETLVWPLYMYDHSGITISLTPFSCPWDSGQVGWVWVPLAKARSEWAKLDGEALRERVFATVKAEMEVLDMYLRGECYGYEVTDEDGDVVDSCFGYYGEKDAEDAAKMAVKEAKAEARSRGNTAKCCQCGDKWKMEDMKALDDNLYCPICYVCVCKAS